MVPNTSAGKSSICCYCCYVSLDLLWGLCSLSLHIFTTAAVHLSVAVSVEVKLVWSDQGTKQQQHTYRKPTNKLAHPFRFIRIQSNLSRTWLEMVERHTGIARNVISWMISEMLHNIFWYSSILNCGIFRFKALTRNCVAIDWYWDNMFPIPSLKSIRFAEKRNRKYMILLISHLKWARRLNKKQNQLA